MQAAENERVAVERARPGTDASELAPSEPVLSARGLTKRYGDALAVEGLTFALRAGTITGFLGPNGAGKTTTLRLLLGLAQPTAGEALIFGRLYQELENPTRRVGAVLESGDFDPGRSGRNHLRVLALATGIAFGRVEELLELVELGITCVELMPIAEFPGRFGWGYDGVDLYAPYHVYGAYRSTPS